MGKSKKQQAQAKIDADLDARPTAAKGKVPDELNAKSQKGTSKQPPKPEPQDTGKLSKSVWWAARKLEAQHRKSKRPHRMEDIMSPPTSPVAPKANATSMRVEFEQFELAQSDTILHTLLTGSDCLRDKTSLIPPWLKGPYVAYVVEAEPSSISAVRKDELRRLSAAPKNDDEKRFNRNCGALKQIASALRTKYPVPPPLTLEAVTTQASKKPNNSSVDFDFDQFENAQSDLLLRNLLAGSNSLRKGRSQLPPWMNDTVAVLGNPSSILIARKWKLRNSDTPPETADERRFLRNCAVMKPMVGKMCDRYPLPQSRYMDPRPPNYGNDLHAATFHDRDYGVPEPEWHKKAFPDSHGSQESFTQKVLRQNRAKKNVSQDPRARSQSQLDPRAPEHHQSTEPSEQSPEISNLNVWNTAVLANGAKSTPTQQDLDDAEKLQRTVLAPFYDRIKKDEEEILRLRKERSDLAAENERNKGELQLLRQESATESGDDQTPTKESRGIKRKLSPPSPMQIGDATNGFNEHTTEGHLAHLASEICNDINQAVPNETIQLCGLAPLKIMEDRPDDVLKLALEKIHTWHYEKVPSCWRRLYEDASLAKAAQLLRLRAGVLQEETVPKRRRLENGTDTDSSKTWFAELVTALDMGIMLSGAPGRASLFESIFQQLENNVPGDGENEVPNQFNITPPKQLKAVFPIDCAREPLGFEDFQDHLDTNRTPIIIPGATANWSAALLWQNPYYFYKLTLGGHRLVPVEVGKSYTDDSWGQKIIPIREFFSTYLLPAEPEDVGYLAQHDLFAQIPTLREDILIPDYCYTTPPPADADAARTSGLAQALQLDQPLLNAWFGPKGTQTPLHTDPYHNILCQVVGYKYVRLYPPSETPELYPRGTDDKGISMANTSQVDVSKHVRTKGLVANGREGLDAEAVREEHKKFPLFDYAKYVEGVLAPGECLYVPVGWWHYVEGLTTSFSVSFWWN